MIDKTKQYTYNGKPVRIYADSSDTHHSQIHAAINYGDGWQQSTFKESELVQVWEPKEGELCYFWDTYNYLIVDKFKAYHGQDMVPFEIAFGIRYLNCAPFKGELPEAFKGLKDD